MRRRRVYGLGSFLTAAAAVSLYTMPSAGRINASVLAVAEQLPVADVSADSTCANGWSTLAALAQGFEPRAECVRALDGLRWRAAKVRGNYWEVCGAKERLQAHHIDGNVRNNSPSNIQTLCVSCHISHHHRARRAGLTVAGRAG